MLGHRRIGSSISRRGPVTRRWIGNRVKWRSSGSMERTWRSSCTPLVNSPPRIRSPRIWYPRGNIGRLSLSLAEVHPNRPENYYTFFFFSILGKDSCLQILIFLQFQRDFQIEYTLIMKRLSVDLKRICSDIIGRYYFIDTWQESWPPLSYPAQRKMSGMNSCLPALRNIDLHLSLLTMGTETCNRHQILVRIKNFSFVT